MGGFVLQSCLVPSRANTCAEMELFCRVIEKPPCVQHHVFSIVY